MVLICRFYYYLINADASNRLKSTQVIPLERTPFYLCDGQHRPLNKLSIGKSMPTVATFRVGNGHVRGNTNASWKENSTVMSSRAHGFGSETRRLCKNTKKVNGCI
jgi:hypothetical protein